ncbi:MAG: D-hexose-6-phosphate mutarotase [Burkholderiales bacterium]|nr:D-hexose-6-phosphate mutarotase [Burkholderiales bacterium]
MLEELNTRFGNLVHFAEAPGGVVCAEVKNESGSATIALFGAQIIDWTPNGEKPVIWLSEEAFPFKGKSLRGGAPVCWPWFGAHSDPSLPAHGFARNAAWEAVSAAIASDGRTSFVLRLAMAREGWPLSLEMRILVGKTLDVDLLTKNEGENPVAVSQALHTYFAVGDIENTRVSGLDGFEYLDKVDGFSRKTQEGDVTFSGEVDRVYLGTKSDAVIEDPVLGRRIVISKTGSSSTVVWNPWSGKAEKMGDLGKDGWKRMLCVENANAAEDTRTLAPGETHVLGVRYRVE